MIMNHLNLAVFSGSSFLHECVGWFVFCLLRTRAGVIDYSAVCYIWKWFWLYSAKLWV